MAYNLRYIEEDDILFTEYIPPVSLEDRVEAMGDNLTLAARFLPSIRSTDSIPDKP